MCDIKAKVAKHEKKQEAKNSIIRSKTDQYKQ